MYAACEGPWENVALLAVFSLVTIKAAGCVDKCGEAICLASCMWLIDKVQTTGE